MSKAFDNRFEVTEGDAVEWGAFMKSLETKVAMVFGQGSEEAETVKKHYKHCTYKKIDGCSITVWAKGLGV